MRVLLAMRVSTGRWLARVEVSDKTAEQFRVELAAELRAPIDEVSVLVAERVAPEAFENVQQVLASGLAIPGAIVWPDDDPDASLVYDAATVDAVTAARIRRIYDGAAGEARAARRWREANETANDPEAPAVDKIEAEVVLAEDGALRDRAEHITTEARVLKQARGWR